MPNDVASDCLAVRAVVSNVPTFAPFACATHPLLLRYVKNACSTAVRTPVAESTTAVKCPVAVSITAVITPLVMFAVAPDKGVPVPATALLVHVTTMPLPLLLLCRLRSHGSGDAPIRTAAMLTTMAPMAGT